MKNGMLERYAEVREDIISQLKKSTAIAPTETVDSKKNERETTLDVILPHSGFKRNQKNIDFMDLIHAFNSAIETFRIIGTIILDKDDPDYFLSRIEYDPDFDKVFFFTRPTEEKLISDEKYVESWIPMEGVKHE